MQRRGHLGVCATRPHSSGPHPTGYKGEMATNPFEPTLSIGDPVPDIELIDHEGRPWRFSEHRGTPILLVMHRHLA